jgi:hypothetical protein
MKILYLKNTWITITSNKQLWNEWNEQEKDGHEVNRQATKKGLALPYQLIL